MGASGLVGEEPVVWHRALVFWSCATAAAAAAGLVVCGVWFGQAMASDASTSAIGLVLAVVGGVPLLSGLILTGAGLALSGRAPRLARGLAVAGMGCVGAVVLVAILLFLPVG